MSVTPAHAPVPPTGAAESAGQETKLGMLRVAKAVVLFVYAVVLLNLVMLILGFALRLLGASTDAEFTRWVYRNVDRIMEPFRGMFPSHAVTEESILDSSLLFAMIVYAIVGIALHALVTWMTDKIVAVRRHQQIAARQAATVIPDAGAPGQAGYAASPAQPGAPVRPGPVGR